MRDILVIVLLFFTLVKSPQIIFSECLKQPIIIDSDVDLDDMIAFLYLLNTQKINLLAITTTSNHKIPHTYRTCNILKLMAYAKNLDTKTPKKNNPLIDFNDFYLPECKNQESFIYDLDSVSELLETSASDLLIKKVINSKEKVVIFCTDSLTNLAKALEKEPSIINNIDKVCILGGTINIKENVIERHSRYHNQFAEHNIFLDEKSVDLVLKSGLNLILIPLDIVATTSFMNAELYRLLVKIKRSSCAEFIFNALNNVNYPYFGINKSVSFLTAIGAALILNPEIGDMILLKLKMNLDNSPYCGMITIDRNGYPINICLKINYELFFKDFVENITK